MQYRDPRAAEARRLRTEEGMSSNEIQQRLGVGKNKLQYWLAGLPTSQGLRPQARDDLKARARALRYQGKTYDEIVEALGVSQSSVSLWVRDIPVAQPEVHRSWTDEARRRRAETYAEKRANQQAERLKTQQDMRRELVPVDEKQVLISGAIAYWCEGTKVKPWRPGVEVTFTNTDPDLLRLFLRFLELVPVPHGGPRFRLDIHENGDEARAKEFWRRELGISHGDFVPTLWKKHNPKTVRKNISDDYHGCLAIRVRKATKLYWYIENLAKAALGVMGMPDAAERA